MSQTVLESTKRSSDKETSVSRMSSIPKIEQTKQLEQMEYRMNLSASDIAHSTENLLRHSRFLTIENFIGIWLNLNIVSKSNDDIFNYFDHLRQIINFFKIFTDLDRCIDYLTKVKNEKVFLIVSGSIWQNFVSLICDMPQVTSIYIFCDDKSEYERWASQYRKVRGVFSRIETLSNELKVDVRLSENALTPISVIPPFSTTTLNKLDSSFMYSQLLKEIILEDKYDEQHKKKLVNFCRPNYVENESDLKIIDEFERRYPHPSTVWWYTRECFLYKMLNKALRTQDSEVMIKMGFVVRDLHQHIAQLHSQQKHQQSFIVYRGQGMAQSEFDKINKNKGGLLAFNSFLSTSTDRQVSLSFARPARNMHDLTGLLFEIEIDVAQSITPFASLDNVSYFEDREKEILFSMHTVFRIEEIRQIEPRLFQVNLTLTNDNDQQLTGLTEYIREATRGQTRVRRLGSLMIAMAEFDKAEEVYTTLFDATSEYDREERAFLHHQFGLIKWEKRNLVSAFSQFQQSLDIYMTYLSSNNPQLSPIYSNISAVLQEQGDLNGALQQLKLALDIDIHALQSSQPNIDLHALQTHHLNIATRHNNIGLVLDNQGKYDEALESYDRALEIELAHLPPLHPLLAATYNNIGLVHQKIGNNLNALTYYQKTLEIFERSLPSNHPSLSNTHQNIAYVLDDLYRTQEAINHMAQAVNIGRHALGYDHPQVKQYQQHLDALRRNL